MGCGCNAALGADSLNTYMGPVPEGVPNPFSVMLHSYPTRYHGPIYTRPMFGFPWFTRPNDFALDAQMMGLGDDSASAMDESIPPAGKVAVAIGLSILVIVGALKITEKFQVRL